MTSLPKRKQLRIKDFDYSDAGAYFVTICTSDRRKVFWSDCRGELCSPENLPLSETGLIVNKEISKLEFVYNNVNVDKYCIMPDHIHLILRIESEENGRTQFAPTLSRIIKQFKGAITKQIGKSVWQRSFYDHKIRNHEDYLEIWEYIENNPCKYL